MSISGSKARLIDSNNWVYLQTLTCSRMLGHMATPAQCSSTTIQVNAQARILPKVKLIEPHDLISFCQIHGPLSAHPQVDAIVAVIAITFCQSMGRA